MPVQTVMHRPKNISSTYNAENRAARGAGINRHGSEGRTVPKERNNDLVKVLEFYRNNRYSYVDINYAGQKKTIILNETFFLSTCMTVNCGDPEQISVIHNDDGSYSAELSPEWVICPDKAIRASALQDNIMKTVHAVNKALQEKAPEGAKTNQVTISDILDLIASECPIKGRDLFTRISPTKVIFQNDRYVIFHKLGTLPDAVWKKGLPDDAQKQVLICDRSTEDCGLQSKVAVNIDKVDFLVPHRDLYMVTDDNIMDWAAAKPGIIRTKKG